MPQVLLLVFLIAHQVIAVTALPGQEDYEVVFPKKLQTQYKRSTEGRYPDVVQYELSIEGEKRILHLEKSEDLLANDYTETYYLSDGQQVTTSPQNKEQCYYQGYIKNENDSFVSVSTCRGLSGVIKMPAQKYLIEPLQLTDGEEHAVYTYESLETSPRVCGVTGSAWEEEPTVLDQKADKKFFTRKQYVEVYVVVDHSVFKKYKEDIDLIKQRVFEMVNYANMVYKPMNIFVALIGMEIWTNQDLMQVVPDIKDALSHFCDWRSADLIKRKKHDNAQLLTNVDFNGKSIGLAFMTQMCSNLYSCGIIQDHSKPSVSVGATMAHEIGHNLGMDHDKSSCKCKEGTCIMTPSLSKNIPKQFSSCSLQNLNTFLSSELAQCMQNRPSRRGVLTKAICGNNFVELGEECDCGTPQECSSSCCNATTCQLQPGAVCSEGECCHECQIKGAGDVCRPIKDDCDLPDLCDGHSPQCPSDRFRVNGFPCKNGEGYCYMGTCPVLQDQCVAMWGEGAKLAATSCFTVNRHGTYFGYCNKKGDKYMRCLKKHVMCGKLYCSGGAEMPTYGNSLKFDKCKSSFPEGPNDEDRAMVTNGTKCGEGMVCMDGQCININSAYRATKCLAKCKRNAVCDHELQCQCKEGYAPPDCEEATALNSDNPWTEAVPSSGEGEDAF